MLFYKGGGESIEKFKDLIHTDHIQLKCLKKR